MKTQHRLQTVPNEPAVAVSAIGMVWVWFSLQDLSPMWGLNKERVSRAKGSQFVEGCGHKMHPPKIFFLLHF